MSAKAVSPAERAAYLAAQTYLTASEAAEYIRSNRHDIYRLVNAERIAATWLGRKIVIRRDELDRFMSSATQIAPAESMPAEALARLN